MCIFKLVSCRHSLPSLPSFYPLLPPPPLPRLPISLGTSKVLARYFQVGSLGGFSGVSVGLFGRIVFISPFSLSSFRSQTLPKCPRTGRSSVLKRPSDSNSALSSVTPRDRSVYAPGTVRSTASNNAPYTEREREREGGTHTSHTSHLDAHAQELGLKTQKKDTKTHSTHFRKTKKSPQQVLLVLF